MSNIISGGWLDEANAASQRANGKQPSVKQRYENAKTWHNQTWEDEKTREVRYLGDSF